MTSFPPRSTEELVDALDRHIRLLRIYAAKAFGEGNLDYGGEVAGKLRLLVTRFGSNRPLLIDLMAKTGIALTVTLGGPRVEGLRGEPGPGDTISLERYLGLDAIGIRIPSGEFVILNKTLLIRAWAEQSGSSHEDWSLDPALAAILSAPIDIGGLQGALVELETTTDAVLGVAERFLSQYRSGASGGTGDA